MPRLAPGDAVAPRELSGLHGCPVPVPDADLLVHLQFRRFAGCPVCNLHLRSIARRHDEIRAAGVREVAVFHSSAESMLPYQGDLPFAVIPDPRRRLYAAFGVETSRRAMLHPRALAAAARGSLARRPGRPGRAENGRSLPADFLIASDGRVVACHYGRHADDQWSVDELLTHAAPASGAVPPGPPSTHPRPRP